MKRNPFLQTCLNAFLVAAMLLTTVPAQGASIPVFADVPLQTSAPALAAAGNWCVAGDWNGWNNSSTPLLDDGTQGDLIPGDGVYSLEVTLVEAKRYEFKAVACGDWNTSFPQENAWLITTVPDQKVTITFDANDHSADAGAVLIPKQNVVNVIGDNPPTEYTAVGGFNGWNNADDATKLSAMGNGFYRLVLTIATAGTYDGKITHTGGWGEQFTAGGRAKDGGSISFTTTQDNQEVVFLLDANHGRLLIAPKAAAGSQTWCAAGDFQGWNENATPLYDDGTNGDLLSGDGVYSRDVTVTTAGRSEWKANSCNWNVSYPGDNAWFYTTQDNQVVKLTLDTNQHSNDAGPAYLETQNIVNAWDSYGSVTVAGLQNWNNDNPGTTLTKWGWLDVLKVEVGPGAHEFKFVRTGSWDGFGNNGRQKNTANRSFNTTNTASTVRFVHDPLAGRTMFYVPPQTAEHDNNIWWNDLGHNSRNSLFRAPVGPVTTNTPVLLRFRSAKGDLTGAQMRLYNDRTNAESTLNMTLVFSDDQYDWWQAEAPASGLPTVYWYRFIAIDGTAKAFYEDDAARMGGWGQAFGTSPDNSWQLTVYDPNYQTPDWVKNGIIYQIFPDRFYDADPANNTPTGSFFYNEEGGTVTRSLDPGGNWNTVVCDPRGAGACNGTYSKNFYGGDLKGITAKLDYLQSLGVTAIYLNPIFESPSNHKYDTTDYLKIDDNFGTLQDFQNLASEANNRGIQIILDGVFNHTSSDSIYFDRYSRWDANGNLTTPGVDDNSGACEGTTSPYFIKQWYYFPALSSPGKDYGVPATCNNGADDAPQTYEAWFSYSSLPKLQANTQEVRDLIWDTPEGVALYWLQQGASGWRLDVGGDVDPGTTNNPTNDYWEGFRSAVQSVKGDAYIVGEEWGNASPWLLGGEWDATMNYQYSSAMLSFWRDSTFMDNDHNTGSSAGVLAPLTPQQLDDRLHNLIERYPPEALYAMMNLLGSHDTNRALFMLDQNTGQNDPSIYQNPDYDWSDAITRLKGVVILQMTLPGAPTIYYGDEVGLVGPPAIGDSAWQDDPYNRQPYPWLENGLGMPFYTSLKSQANQDALFQYYQVLTTARNSHAALRTGSFDTLKVDNDNKVYAYGRRAADFSDAAVVILNRKDTAQDIVVDVAGYLPVGAELDNVLNDAAPVYLVDASGQLTVNVPPMSGAVLVYSGGATLNPPAVPTNVQVTNEGNGTLTLSWDAAGLPADVEYIIERSLASGGGYSQAGTTADITFTDSGLTNAQIYYYVIRTRHLASGLTSEASVEVSGMPHLIIGWAGNMTPTTLTRSLSATPSDPVYAQVWIDGESAKPGATPTLLAQIGYGATGSDPTGWTTWHAAAYNTAGEGTFGNNDEFMGTLMPDAVGSYDYTYRFSTTAGRVWTYLSDRGVITITAPADTIAPNPPTELHLIDFGRSYLTLGWSAPADLDVYAYDVYRSDVSGSGFVKLGRTLAPLTEFTDDAVITGQTYYYYVVTVDTSFNTSQPSAEFSAVPQAKIVNVTINVTVPQGTPPTVYFSRVISNNTAGDWNPAGHAMTQVNDTLWTTTFRLEDGTKVDFKFARGSWETVEKDAAGAEINNRSLTAAYGTDGNQVLDFIVERWRDPFVSSYTPANGAMLTTPESVITFTWSRPLPVAGPFAGTLTRNEVENVPGSSIYDENTLTVTFTPDAPLAEGRYTFTISGQSALSGDAQQVQASWSFTYYKPVWMVNIWGGGVP